jgi:hypothetical protein
MPTLQPPKFYCLHCAYVPKFSFYLSYQLLKIQGKEIGILY